MGGRGAVLQLIDKYVNENEAVVNTGVSEHRIYWSGWGFSARLGSTVVAKYSDA